MKELSLLMGILDYLNEIRSEVVIENYNKDTGEIKLSNHIDLNIKDLKKPKDIRLFLHSEDPQNSSSNGVSEP